MQILHAAGMQLGKSATESLNAAPGSPRGEGRIRDEIYKPILEQGGFDPLGQTSLPPVGWEPDFITPEELREKVIALAQIEDMDKPWGFKAIKGLLFWPLFDKAFPDAKWVTVARPVNEHIQSLIRTPFMTVHDTEAGWRQYLLDIFLYEYDLRNKVKNSMVLELTNVRDSGDYTYVRTLLDWLGLKWSDTIYNQFKPWLYKK